MRAKQVLLTASLTVLLLISCMDVSEVQQNAIPQPSLIPPMASPPTSTIVQISPTAIHDYLTNPGIGWQNGPESSSDLILPETVAYAHRQLIAWSMLNPAEGVYDWSALDEQLNQTIRQGKQFSFRIYTHIGEKHGANMVPAWVLNKGAVLLSNGEPDYSNCVYQETWGQFISELVRIYDGNPAIAFIDVSGYGNFNEWSWQNDQTQWDDQWNVDYENGNPSPQSFKTLDGQARRRLADIFIGGSFNGHECRATGGETVPVNYAYTGFQHTQLLMPYAGIIQSSQYVYYRRQDIGFRYDCLGRDGQSFFQEIGAQINKVWKRAPIAFELCGPQEVDLENVQWLLQVSHPSFVHDNQWAYSRDQLEQLLLNVGYRYFLKAADLKIDGRGITLKMEWQNVGSAPNYPRMGQKFTLDFYLLDSSGRSVYQENIPADISLWLPASEVHATAPSYWITHDVELPVSLASGTYQIGVAVVDERTAKPIQLAVDGNALNGIHLLSVITIP